MEDSELREMSFAELKKACALRGLPNKGKTSDLRGQLRNEGCSPPVDKRIRKMVDEQMLTLDFPFMASMKDPHARQRHAQFFGSKILTRAEKEWSLNNGALEQSRNDLEKFILHQLDRLERELQNKPRELFSSTGETQKEKPEPKRKRPAARKKSGDQLLVGVTYLQDCEPADLAERRELGKQLKVLIHPLRMKTLIHPLRDPWTTPGGVHTRSAQWRSLKASLFLIEHFALCNVGAQIYLLASCDPLSGFSAIMKNARTGGEGGEEADQRIRHTIH